MAVTITFDEDISISVDRSGSIENSSMRQGFDIRVDDLVLHFNDEHDAERLALAIAKRLGLQFS